MIDDLMIALLFQFGLFYIYRVFGPIPFLFGLAGMFYVMTSFW